MRRAFIAFLLLAATASADTIVLTNGTSLSVDRARDKGDKIEYVMGGTTYTLPKSSVVRIETGGPTVSIGPVVKSSAVPPPSDVPPVASASPRFAAEPAKIAITAPAEDPELAARRAALRKQIMNLGQVDPVALGQVELQGQPMLTAAAYLEAGRLEMEHGNAEKAGSYFRQGLKFAPDSAALLEWYAACLLEQRRFPEAASQAQRATRVAPNSADAFRLLGTALYEQERVPDAVQAWQRAVKLRPDPDLRYLLAKAQREANVQENFREEESYHFSLRYDGQRTSLGVQRALLSTLERQYQQLIRDLDFAPRENIVVVLYTRTAFFDVTQAPTWAGGLNDGKLRIPIEGVRDMSPELERVLKHELVHSFIRYMAGPECPAWLNEGLAQMLEPRNSEMYAPALAKVFQAGHEAPMKALEGSFGRYSSKQAQIAYMQSLMITDYLRGTVGMSGLQRMLQRIAHGESGEAALRGVNHTTYAQFEDEFGKWLVNKYGQ
jgi:tetratricopeptide (TPR) repeat protein